MYTCWFSVSQMRQFCLFTYPPRSKWASSEKMIFLPKSASSLSRSQAHLAKRKRIGWSIGFNSWTNWTLYDLLPRSLCKIRLNDVSETFNCWKRRWIDVDGASHTLSATAAIFSGVRNVFGFSRFGLSMRMPVSINFFTRQRTYGADGASLHPKSVPNFRTHSATLPWFSGYCDITQPYSFGGRIKLIICRIRHKLSVTIHEISTSWKKRLDGGPNTWGIPLMSSVNLLF